MNDQDQITEDERHEAAAEEPINGAAGVRALPHFPSGADGTEPEPKKRSEVEKLNSTLFGILRNAVVIATDAMHDYVEEGITEEDGNVRMLAACTEIRKLVDFYKPDEGKGRIVIEHDGKKYGVDDFEVVEGFFNDHIQVAFGMCICPKCGCDRSWIMAKELK